MTLRGNHPDGSDNHGAGQDIQKSQPYQRRGNQAARHEIRIGRRDHFVERWNSSLNPGADATDEEISIQRHLTEDENGASLGLAIELREGCDRDLTFPHNPGSAP